MGFVRIERGKWPSWTTILCVVCIALVLFTGAVHAAHFHPNGQVDHDCALCVTAHQVVQAAAVVVLMLCSQPVERRIAERATPAPRQRFVLKLANRPPPVPAFA